MVDPPKPALAHPGKLMFERRISLAPRGGVDRTLYFFSFSGALLIQSPLPILDGIIDGKRYEILPPLRIGHPAFRPTPQFTAETISRFWKLPDPLPFAIQVAAFASPHGADGASATVWNGPGENLAPDAPEPPPDTILIILHGRDSSDYGDLLQKYLLEPFLEWLWALSDQWWVGRSYEGISGPLHFVAPVNQAGDTVGNPTPVARIATAGLHMRVIDDAIWIEAAEKSTQGILPGSLALATDAKFFLASNEFRAGCVLACGAFEAARNDTLAAANVKLRALRCSETDLLCHLSAGFGRAFHRNLEREAPQLFAALRAYWIARGHAARGRPLQWRFGDERLEMDQVELSSLTSYIDDILAWIADVRLNLPLR